MPEPTRRPKNVHTKHLTERERFRIRTLYYDASMSKKRIAEITGHSLGQIRHAVSAKSSAVAPRSGRPRKVRNGQGPANQPTEGEGSSAQGLGEESSAVASSESTPAQPPSRRPLATPQEGVQRAAPSFTNLPPEIRRHIWQLVLTSASSPPPSSSSPPSTAPSSSSFPSPSPLSCTFWLEKLPHTPHLLAGVFPQHWDAHCKQYLARRQPTARALCRVSREARQAVLDTFAPVWSEAGHRALGSTVPFLLVDPRHDRLCYRHDASDLPGLLAMSRAAVLPRLSPAAGGGGAVGGVDRR
ncbi:hypothetical protein F5Y05DRAFT_342311 [Hypoxylon sp. FL0543]|nr:hypothetical protein F5Y05DRAFT_342311 [Hypoxylon sp. FL0543]